eukprot:532910-Pelagomonas_calceolata.AAC.2
MGEGLGSEHRRQPGPKDRKQLQHVRNGGELRMTVDAMPSKAYGSNRHKSWRNQCSRHLPISREVERKGQERKGRNYIAVPAYMGSRSRWQDSHQDCYACHHARTMTVMYANMHVP